MRLDWHNRAQDDTTEVRLELDWGDKADLSSAQVRRLGLAMSEAAPIWERLTALAIIAYHLEVGHAARRVTLRQEAEAIARLGPIKEG